VKVLVIGGSGFIGARLISTLRERGHTIVNLDVVPLVPEREGVTTMVGDVTVDADVAAAADGCDAIVLLAAEHRDDVRPVSRYEAVNVGGARTVAAVAERLGIDRLVFTSTVAVYGLSEGIADEDATPRPFNPYGETKLKAEGVLRAWADADLARSLVIVRPSVVFGEGNRGNVYTLVRQIAAGRFLMVGRGDNRKSMAYVGNIVSFLADALGFERGTTLVNFADKPDLSTREIVAIIRGELGKRPEPGPGIPVWVALVAGAVFDGIARISGRTFPISAIRIKKFAAETRVGTARLENRGHRSPVPIDDAVRRMVAAEFPREH
jgi:nucleoside-diphosphate-sugar epimerase